MLKDLNEGRYEAMLLQIARRELRNRLTPRRDAVLAQFVRQYGLDYARTLEDVLHVRRAEEEKLKWKSN